MALATRFILSPPSKPRFESCYETVPRRWALLETVAHMITQDWPALALSLKTLGFIPPGVDPLQVRRPGLCVHSGSGSGFRVQGSGFEAQDGFAGLEC